MSQLKTIPAPYGKDVVDDDGNKMSHVIGAGVDQGAAPLRTETLGENLKAIVEKHPSKECIVDVYADVSFTYERFYNRVLRLATAFVRPRELLVLDEPEQRLDVEGVAWLGERLKSDLAGGLAIVLASHEPALLEAIGARSIRLGV